ncbi:hypothetical protein HJG60_008187 [Phyllostomus discolor]|uniref:Uncharacterized protein n=1 Tax=Phyllostomus discolor TaxID=89673 RepID=A0A833ZAX8_9CHIR|nr:hypothetical protein HJG60_008187 [Phyllostomus discolor]
MLPSRGFPCALSSPLADPRLTFLSYRGTALGCGLPALMFAVQTWGYFHGLGFISCFHTLKGTSLPNASAGISPASPSHWAWAQPPPSPEMSPVPSLRHVHLCSWPPGRTQHLPQGVCVVGVLWTLTSGLLCPSQSCMALIEEMQPGLGFSLPGHLSICLST